MVGPTDQRQELVLRRSALFVPGGNARAIEKAKGLACDVVIFDLEDSIHHGAKSDARDQVVQALLTGDFGHSRRSEP